MSSYQQPFPIGVSGRVDQATQVLENTYAENEMTVPGEKLMLTQPATEVGIALAYVAEGADRIYNSISVHQSKIGTHELQTQPAQIQFSSIGTTDVVAYPVTQNVTSGVPPITNLM